MLPRSSLLLFCCIALAACTESKRTFLINGETSSPIIEAEIPRSGAECASRELHFSIGHQNDVGIQTCDNGRCRKTALVSLKFFDRSGRVDTNNVTLGSGNTSEGPVIPVQGPDDLLWLCREDDDAQECVCIPWAQD